MTEAELENFYREHLEENIIECFSQRLNISLKEAMRLFYSSRLSERIHSGDYGIQYLDYTILTDLLVKEFENGSI